MTEAYAQTTPAVVEKKFNCAISNCAIIGSVGGVCPFHFAIDFRLSSLVTRHLSETFCEPGRGEGLQNLTKAEAFKRNRQLGLFGATALSDVIEWYGKEIRPGAILVREWTQLKNAGRIPEAFDSPIKSSSDLFRAVNERNVKDENRKPLCIPWIVEAYEDWLIDSTRQAVEAQADRMGLDKTDSALTPEEGIQSIRDVISQFTTAKEKKDDGTDKNQA